MTGKSVVAVLLIAVFVSWASPCFAQTAEERVDIIRQRAEQQIGVGKFDDVLASGQEAVQIAPK